MTIEHADRRRYVASLARKLMAGEMSLDAFFGQLQSGDWDDSLLAELLDLIEDEPVRSRVFGVGPRGYEEYRGRVTRLIERAETSAPPDF
jgi:hypothetical protein